MNKPSFRWNLRMVMSLVIGVLIVNATYSQDIDTRDLTKEDVSLQTQFIDAKKLAFLGKYDKAIDGFKLILDDNLKTPAVYYELAKIYREEDQPELAYKNIKKAILYDKSNVWYYIFLAELQEDENDLKGIQETYVELNRIKQNDPELMLKLGDVSTQLADYRTALNVYDSYEDLFGVSEKVSQSKFEIYKLQNDQKSALQVLSQLADAFPDDERFRNNMVVYKKELDAGNGKKNGNRPKGGIAERYQELIENDAIDLDTKIAELVVLTEEADKLNSEDALQIEKIVNAFAESYSDQAKALALAGDFYFNQGNYAKAATHYEQTLSLDKSKYAVWAAYSDALALQSDFQKLRDVSENALDFFPSQALFYYYNGVSNAELGHAADDNNALTKAGETLSIAASMSKRKPSLFYNVLLAQAQNQIWLGDKKKATEFLENADALQSGDTKNMEYIRNQL